MMDREEDEQYGSGSFEVKQYMPGLNVRGHRRL